VRESFDFLSGDTLFNTFDAVLRCQNKFSTADDREAIEKLYLFLIELSENEDLLFTEEQEKLLDLFYITVYIERSLFTDDSFKFNEIVRELSTDMLDSLPLYK
jgi:hypothetical protein